MRGSQVCSAIWECLLRRSLAHGGPLSYGKRCTNSWWAIGAIARTSNLRRAASSMRIRSTTRRAGTSTIVEGCTPTPHAPSTGSFAHPPDSKLRARLSLVDAGSAPVRPPFDHPPAPAHLLRRPVLSKPLPYTAVRIWLHISKVYQKLYMKHLCEKIRE